VPAKTRCRQGCRQLQACSLGPQKGYRTQLAEEDLCFRQSRWRTHSYAYADYDSNSNTNAVAQREPYPYTESDTEVAPDSTVAPDSFTATVS
jgi:hypothetical protein